MILVKCEILTEVLQSMTTKALLIDFGVLAPVHINYQRVLDEIAKVYPQYSKLALGDTYGQIELIKEKAPKKEFESFASKMGKVLDEIEASQVKNFSLNMGVKKALAALDTMDVAVVALTEMGKESAEKFLKDNEIDNFIGQLVSREKIGEPFDLGSRLNKALEKEQVKQEECVYFCNRLSDLKLAKAANFRTIVLPSKSERLDLMMMEKPLGMIMSLEEIPNLLSLEAARSAKPKRRQIPSVEVEPEGSSQEPPGGPTDTFSETSAPE